jgi:hypothetical protein
MRFFIFLHETALPLMKLIYEFIYLQILCIVSSISYQTDE